MTNAAIPVTERAVEQFVDAYLTALGGEIRKEGQRWTISLPETADTDLDLDNAVLEIANDPEEVDDETIAITPESPFVERMLDEAAERLPIGSITLAGEDWGIQLPSWITAGPAAVVNQAFTPYYDRRALCMLFHVGIETVSEFQREELHAVAIDLNDFEERSSLAETFLELTEGDDHQLFFDGRSVDGRSITEAIDPARAAVEDEIAPTIQETRERATRAAEVELDEYQQLVRQQRDEVGEKIDRLNERIKEVNETTGNSSTRKERVDALRKRKQLRSELEELRSEENDLTDQIEAGFSEKHDEIRERHSLTVRIRPVTATEVIYERGELKLTFRAGNNPTEIAYAYEVGSGVMRHPTCERCGQEFTAENPLMINGKKQVGSICCGD